MTQATLPAVVIRRTYDVPRERLYEAWTTPELAKQFLGPDDVSAEYVTMDVRPGGTYSIVMKMANGERWRVGGIYREVRPPERLQMTWTWEEDDRADERQTLLTLEFNEVDGGTELVLTHQQFASDESRAGHARGWEAILAELAGLLRA